MSLRQEGLAVANAARDAARAIEPAVEQTTRDDLVAVATAVDALTAWLATYQAELLPPARGEVDEIAAAAYSRAAAVAVAAGDEQRATSWIAAARGRCVEPEARAILDAAPAALDRYRRLVHARYLFSRHRTVEGLALCEELAAGPSGDAITESARRTVADHRPARGLRPTLWRLNGFGLGFYGARDRDVDGSYVTTQCVSALWVPLVPIGAYRVQRADDGYFVLAREPLSGFAKRARIAVIAALAVAIVGGLTYRHMNDPARRARARFDAAIASAGGGDRERALARLDDELSGPDLGRVDDARRERAGAAIVRLSGEAVADPFTEATLDQALRVVRRYQGLPSAAQGGAARQAMLAYLDRWIARAYRLPEAQLALLREAVDLARHTSDQARVARFDQQAAAIRVELARSRADEWPLDALGVLADGVADPSTVAAASAIVERLVGAPSLLDDARHDVDWWLAAVPAGDPLRAKVIEARDRAAAARAEAEAEDVTAAALAAMQKARPWDQRVALRLAHAELEAGKPAEAAARLRALGPTGMLVREGRAALGQLAAAEDRLADADAILSALLWMRVGRFATASARLDAAARRVQEQVAAQLDRGSAPASLERAVQAASSDGQRRELVMKWMSEQIEADPDVIAARPAYEAVADVVPLSVALGSVKLRRAQALAGAERERMLADAERTFLAVRTHAEGQPELELALGEIHARLGKTAESEAAFARVIERDEPPLTLAVAKLYRELGNLERARELGTKVFESAPSPTREGAAVLLGLMARDDDEAERWYRKADSTEPFVRTALLELEAGRLQREGKHAQCAGKLTEAARAHLATASAAARSGYNNAAIAYQRAYACNGDPALLQRAVAALEQAYRFDSDSPIVVGNLGELLGYHARLKVLGRRLDLRALALDADEAEEVLDALVIGRQREAVLAELAGEASWRRNSELMAQYEVLAPGSSRGYEVAYAQARLRRDEAAAAAAIERLKRATAIDTSEAAAQRARWTEGALDARLQAQSQSDAVRLDELAARAGLAPRTRAAALLLAGIARTRLGVLGDAAALARARDDLTAAMRLWPELALHHVLTSVTLDAAGLTADAARWRSLRRTRGAAAVLHELGPADPLVAAVRASPAWPQLLELARADVTRPGLDDLYLARVLGDPALLERARGVLTDPFVRLDLERRALVDPSDPMLAADRALLDGR